MKNDKKNAAGNINFSLLTGIGSSTFNCSVENKNIKESLIYYQNLD
jgi:3-dehydroquinate synthase